MVEIPLSKRGWASVIGTIVLLPILGGFLSAFGEDLYQFSKSMAIDPQFQYVILPIIVLIGLGIIIGVVLVVYDVYKQRHKLPKGASHPTFSGIETDTAEHRLSMDDFEIEGERAKTTESKRDKENKWKHFPSNSR